MKLLKAFLLVGLLQPGLNFARSTGGGNGGLIEEMRKAEKLASHFLTREEVEDLLYLDGRQLKESLLQPIAKALDTNEINDPKAKAIWSLMKDSKEVGLAENITYTRMEEGECPDQQDLCTGDSHYSTIYFDMEKIVSKKTTVAELTGMVFHELSHHFAGEMDHPYYPLANFIKNRVAEGKIGQRVFNIYEVFFRKHSHYHGLWHVGLFCESKGFNKTVSYTKARAEHVKALLGHVKYAYWIDEAGLPGMEYYPHILSDFEMGDKPFVTEVTCE